MGLRRVAHVEKTIDGDAIHNEQLEGERIIWKILGKGTGFSGRGKRSKRSRNIGWYRGGKIVVGKYVGCPGSVRE